jgi:hypothetical protein
MEPALGRSREDKNVQSSTGIIAEIPPLPSVEKARGSEKGPDFRLVAADRIHNGLTHAAKISGIRAP